MRVYLKMLLQFSINLLNIQKYVLIGIKRMLQIPGRIRRQGILGGLSGLAPVAVAGVATAGVFRNEIADIVSDLVGKNKIIGS